MPRPKSGRPPKVASAFRLSTEALRLLELLADSEGATKTFTLEMLIRQRAKSRGIK